MMSKSSLFFSVIGIEKTLISVYSVRRPVFWSRVFLFLDSKIKDLDKF